MDARVEAFVDGTLPPDEHARFEARRLVDPYWQTQVEHARTIRATLRTQDPPGAPTDLTDAILRHAAADPST
jgi:anti-sigma factor RsiW